MDKIIFEKKRFVKDKMLAFWQVGGTIVIQFVEGRIEIKVPSRKQPYVFAKLDERLFKDGDVNIDQLIEEKI